MNDKELADRIVALGVGEVGAKHRIGAYGIFDGWEWSWNMEYHFVRDWRVSGALMERCDAGEVLIWQQKYTKATDVWIVETEIQDADARNESLPRAIIEACVEALT